MRNFLLPQPPAVGPLWYALSAVVHTVFLGLLAGVSTHTLDAYKDKYDVTHFIPLSLDPDITRQFSMRVSDPVGVGMKWNKRLAELQQMLEQASMPDIQETLEQLRQALERRGLSNASTGMGSMGPVSISDIPVGGSPGARQPGAIPDSLSIGIPGASGRIPGAIMVGTRRYIGPTYGDGLLWEEPDVGIIGEGEEWGAQESLLALEVAEMLSDILEDSLWAREEIPRWVTTIGGQEWGIDSQYIHLGPVKIPTVLAALLAFADLPQMGNYELAQQEAWLADVRNQILTQAQRMDQMKAFKRGVKALEARKRKERDEERRRRGIVAGRDSP